MTPFLFIILDYLPWVIVTTMFLFKILSSSNPSRKVYLVNHASFKAKKSQQFTREETIAWLQTHEPKFTNETIEMQRKMIMASGIGDATYLPESILSEPPDVSMEGVRKEAQAAIYGAVDALVAKTGLKFEDIGVLVVNCSTFNPVPSLCSMIVSRYKLKESVKSFCLTGMGCSSSLAAIGLANQLLQVHENSCALVVSTEVVLQNMHRGNNPKMLAANCVFRVGGAAILLSNKPSDRDSSKYQLIHTLRTNTSSSNNSYKCVFREEDSEGIQGISITKDLLVVASYTIKAHLTTLGKVILPFSDKLIFGFNQLIKKLHLANPKPYKPNFGSVIDHFFPQVGGKIMIDELEKNIKLDVEAARMTLHRYGNTSSSSVWYEMAYAEAKGRVKRGHRVWQIAFGAGFKCASVIWVAMRDVNAEDDNPWLEEIGDYPLKLERFKPVPLVFDQVPE